MAIASSLAQALAKALARNIGDNTGGFVPANLSNLQLWLDASDTSTITDSSGSVSAWADKSGNGNNATQGTGALQPTTGVSTKNGKNVINFDGTDGLSLPSGLFSIPNGSSTTFIVSRINAETGVDQVMLDMTEAGAERYLFTYVGNAPTGRIYFQSRASGGAGVIDTGNTNTDWNVLRARRDGLIVAISVNNETEVTDTDGQDESGIDAATIGMRGSGVNGMAGSIAEIIIYNRSLVTAERTQVYNYLSNKWGI